MKPVLMMIVQIRLRYQGRYFDTFGFLDGGSNATLISGRAARRLQLQGPNLQMPFDSWRDEPAQAMQSSAMSFEMLSRNEETQLRITRAYVVQNLCVTDQQYTGGFELAKIWSHLEGIDVPNVDGSQIDVLIGLDVARAHIQLDIREPEGTRTEPIAFKTHFGWCLAGPTQSPAKNQAKRSKGSINRASINVNQLADDDELSLRELLERPLNQRARNSKPKPSCPKKTREG